MIERLKFFITDVFAEARYSGNQLATLLGAGSLSTEQMQRIAHEIHFSETTFVISDHPRDGAFDVRIFTPAAEVDFAGHPTLGTAHVIRRALHAPPGGEVVLNLKVGRVPVSFEGTGDGEILWMRQVEPVFRETVPPDEVAAVLGLSPGDIEGRWPVEQVSTGLPHIVVPLRSLEALRRLAVERTAYDRLVSRTWAKVILAFAPEGYRAGHDLAVRVFPIALGISEDPATGSGNGCLAAYLVKHRVLGSNALDVRAGQGYEIGRPSLLFLRAREDAGRFDIEVGGRVIHVAEGLWG